ncbi:hypothetical protein ACYJ1Y_12575 [Natrialbaceae archaeon A-gly3]
MSDALYTEYPAVYDALYAEKPYDAEVEFVAEYVEAGDRVLVVGVDLSEAMADRLTPGGTLVLDTMSMPEDGSDIVLRTHDRPEGHYARIFQVHRCSESQCRWESLVFTPDGWFVDVHDLVDVPAEALEGYGEAGTSPVTVVVANYGKS